MRRGERIPLHNHDGPDSGGLVTQSTAVTGGVGSTGAAGGTALAADVSIADTAGLYAATTLETALAEIALATTFLHNLEALGDIPLGLAEL